MNEQEMEQEIMHVVDRWSQALRNKDLDALGHPAGGLRRRKAYLSAGRIVSGWLQRESFAQSDSRPCSIKS